MKRGKLRTFNYLEKMSDFILNFALYRKETEEYLQAQDLR